MTPEEYCRKKTKESHSNFLFAFIFLKKNKKSALTALYAFCREVDDIVDGDNKYKIGKQKLNWWRAEIDRLYDNKPKHPVSKALKSHIKEYSLDKASFIEIINGMEMDLNFHRYENFKQLQLYCYRVASTVGVLSAKIFGYSDNKTLKYAHNLGIALQLTNIIRDIGEDSKRGRIYIPKNELKKFNVSEAEILNNIKSKEIKDLVEHQTVRAKYFYRLAVDNLPNIDRKNQKPGLMMGNIYYVLLLKIIKSNPENLLNQRISLSAWRKMLIALLTLFNCHWIQ